MRVFHGDAFLAMHSRRMSANRTPRAIFSFGIGPIGSWMAFHTSQYTTTITPGFGSHFARSFLTPTPLSRPFHHLEQSCSPGQLSTRAATVSLLGPQFIQPIRHNSTTFALNATAATTHQPTVTTPRMVMVRDNVELNDVEKELFSTLLAATKHAGASTVLRCAGGWVRDKLLGKESVDIDIALDNMLGKDFAELVNQYLSSQGREVRQAAVIQSNPDQSKHLETARMKISGLWIDLVNLRSETYAQDSRIPQMEFGTPRQDAMRRDFTVNSLFYNINEGSVEDFTERGLQDLRSGLIRTPLPPQETFLDDPLRVLRAVRFATRFGFELDAAILEAAASDPVREALGQKVSKERIGTELEGMFNGQSPLAAVELLHSLSLFAVVFALPPTAAKLVGQDYGTACVACMRATFNLLKARSMQVDLEERRFLLLAALLLPLREAQVPTGAKGKPQPVSQHVVREAIKWRAKDADVSMLLHEVAPTLMDVYVQLSTSGTAGQPEAVSDAVKLALASAIRKLKQHWRLGVLLAPVSAAKAAAPLGVDPASGSGSPAAGFAAFSEPGTPEMEVTRSSEVVGTLMAAAEAFGLQDCWQWKPLLDGKQVMAALGLQKPGPELGRAMAAAMDWQLVHPSGTQDQCQQHLKEWWAGQR